MSQYPQPDPDWIDTQAATQPVSTHKQDSRSSAVPIPLNSLLEPDPTDPLAVYQAIRIQRRPTHSPKFTGCGCMGGVGALFLIILAAYFLFPSRIRLVLLGVDTREAESVVGRTDTIILMQVNPLTPEIHMLSIPRDLWVVIPGIGENRINTAHFFAEANRAGSGPQAVIDTVESNFGFLPRYYARVRFSGFRDIVDAMGGLDIVLTETAGGLEPGRHHLDGEQALAFARDRKQGDDFGRMNQGQLVLVAAARRLINPLVWPRLPAVFAAFFQSVDTDLPVWDWPRIAVALARAAGTDAIDQRTLTREMTNPFTTDGGAQVLGPNWDLIRPMIAEMFWP
jgi:LCP family protein required for cell wall assembly